MSIFLAFTLSYDARFVAKYYQKKCE